MYKLSKYQGIQNTSIFVAIAKALQYFDSFTSFIFNTSPSPRAYSGKSYYVMKESVMGQFSLKSHFISRG